ncbi:response regulator transcription factor [Erythrobacter sp. JK5]|uniref:response regulator n=1 Tax=Erythrobacter sp. JK5 TaxID=2829500 RepID=UPI001BA62435|nr:response regulator transcription factor [Erythrobacter sp. JK5]QUL37637.1 response regulator transcription factor [Erythrobacter sp. JK5]
MVVADDHALIRQASTEIISRIPNTTVVAEAEDGLDAITKARTFQPDLLVLDEAMPLAKGFEVLAEVRRWCPNTRIVMLTGLTSHNLLADYLDQDVDGLLLKSCSADEIRRCFEIVLAGHKYAAEEVRRILRENLGSRSLTAREGEVLSLVATGASNVEIADRLGISVKTVEKHRASLMAKLEVNSVAQLLAVALREGYLDAHKQL